MELEFANLIYSKRFKNNKNSLHNRLKSRVWSQKCADYPIDLMKVMDKYGNLFNYAYSSLFADNRDILEKNPIYNRKKIQAKKASNFLKYISADSEKLLNKMYTKINFIKDETKELQKLNTLNLQKISKSYFRTNNPKTSRQNYSIRDRIYSSSKNFQTKTISFNLNNCKPSLINKFKNNTDSKTLINLNGTPAIKNDKKILYTITNENTKGNSISYSLPSSKRRKISSSFNRSKKLKNLLNYNKSKFSLKRNKNKKLIFQDDILGNNGEEKYRNLKNLDVPKLYSTIKKKDLNFARLNDVYRLQMNKSFGKFNAENHLKELNKIQRDDMTVRHDMEDIKSKMNQKINDRNQGLYYKKEYLKLLDENEKHKRRKSLEAKPFPFKIPFNILFRSTKDNKTVKVFPHGYKIRAFYDYCYNCEKIQKIKDMDLIELGADILFGHFHNKDHARLYNSLDELFNTLEVEPIVKYIDNFKNQKVNKDKEELKNRIKNYFPVLTECEKRIQKLQYNQNLKKRNLIDEPNILLKIDETKRLINENRQKSV